MSGSVGIAIKFTSGGAFHREVDRGVRVLLADRGLVRRAYLTLWVKAFVVLVWTAASYGALVFVAEGPWQALAASVSLGLAVAGIGFTIMHDANHHAFAPRRSVNRVLALSLDLIGGSSYVWSAKHLAHHTYPNVTEHDPDIESLPFARLDPAQHHRPWHRYQHLYIWALYALITLRWQFFSDFVFLQVWKGRSKPVAPPPRRCAGNADRRQGRVPDLGGRDPARVSPAGLGAGVLPGHLVRCVAHAGAGVPTLTLRGRD